MKKLLAMLLLGCGHQVSYTLAPRNEWLNSKGEIDRSYHVIAKGDDLNKCRDTAIRAAAGVCTRIHKGWYVIDSKEESTLNEALFEMDFGCY